MSITNSSSIMTFNEQRNNYAKEDFSVYIKILINYSQMIGIIQNLNLEWPFYITDFFKILTSFGFISTQILTLDCFFNNNLFSLSRIYLNGLSSVLLYIALLFASFLFFFLSKFLLKKKKQFNKFIMFFLILSVMFQPNGIKDSSDIVSCQNVDGKNYVVDQMSIECYTLEHNKWVKNFIYIKIIIF